MTPWGPWAISGQLAGLEYMQSNWVKQMPSYSDPLDPLLVGAAEALLRVHPQQASTPVMARLGRRSF